MVMGWRDPFKNAPPPPPFDDPRLGVLQWVAEQDGWCGSMNGLSFVLGNDPRSQPPEALKDYAHEILHDRPFLERALREAIQAASSHYLELSDEMKALQYDELHFSISPKGRRLFATLGPGARDRCWRLEFLERTCLGIGYDS